MSLLDRPSISRAFGFADDGPVRPDGSWKPDNGRELYFHAHLQEPLPGQVAEADDVTALALLKRISALDDTAAIAALVEEDVAFTLPVNRYVVEENGSVRHVTLEADSSAS